MKRHLPLLLIAAFCLLALAYGRDGFAVQAQPLPQQNPPVVNVPGTVSPATPTQQSQPAVPVAQVTSPAAPAHFEEQALWAIMISFVIQWLKKSTWFGWITTQSPARLQTQFGFLAAVLTAAGVHFAVAGSFLDNNGVSFTVTGLSVTAFKDIAWQWAAQQTAYRVVVKEVGLPHLNQQQPAELKA